MRLALAAVVVASVSACGAPAAPMAAPSKPLLTRFVSCAGDIQCAQRANTTAEVIDLETFTRSSFVTLATSNNAPFAVSYDGAVDYVGIAHYTGTCCEGVLAMRASSGGDFAELPIVEGSRIVAIVPSADGRSVYVVTTTDVRQLDAATLAVQTSVAAPGGVVLVDAQLSADGSMLAVATNVREPGNALDNYLYLVDTAAMEFHARIQVSPLACTQRIVGFDGPRVVLASQPAPVNVCGEIAIVDTQRGALVGDLRAVSAVLGISPLDHRAWIRSGDQVIAVDLERNEPSASRTVAFPANLDMIEVTPAGDRLIIATRTDLIDYDLAADTLTSHPYTFADSNGVATMLVHAVPL